MKLVNALKLSRMETVSVNVTLVYNTLCDFKTWTANECSLVIEFHVWKSALCNSPSVLFIASFEMLHVQTPHNLCMFSSENYIIGRKKINASMILRCYII